MTGLATEPKHRFSWFQLFKYTVYSLLVLNVLLFLNKELKSAAHRFADGVAIGDLINAFSSTIDTGAWVVLILIFELETYIIPDEKLKGHIKWLLRIIRSVSYTFICSAFYGYVTKFFWVMEFASVDISSLCQYVGQSWMIEPDVFKSITKDNCAKLSTSTEFLQLADKNIFTNIVQWKNSYRLALVDIFNAAAWILVVVVLEIDIWLQLKGKLKGRVYKISKIIKAILYSVLLGAAIYWGFLGSFLEFWDAFLWIVAFIFIENNLFEWQAETNEPSIF